MLYWLRLHLSLLGFTHCNQRMAQTSGVHSPGTFLARNTPHTLTTPTPISSTKSGDPLQPYFTELETDPENSSICLDPDSWAACRQGCEANASRLWVTETAHLLRGLQAGILEAKGSPTPAQKSLTHHPSPTPACRKRRRPSAADRPPQASPRLPQPLHSWGRGGPGRGAGSDCDAKQMASQAGPRLRGGAHGREWSVSSRPDFGNREVR